MGLFLALSAGLLGSATLAAYLNIPPVALLLALIGFGLCMTAILYAALPGLSQWLQPWSRRSRLALLALLTLALAVVGFSSTVVIAVVLFMGGFIAGTVYWRILTRILRVRPREEPPTPEEPVSPPPLPGVVPGIMLALVVAFLAAFFVGYYRLLERGGVGMALLFGSGGLVLGVFPTVYRLSRQRVRPEEARGVGPRPLVRDLLFAVVITGLIGYEVSLATEGIGFLGVPPLTVAIVVLSYIWILIRSLYAYRSQIRPFKPLLIAALGVLLFFAPLIVLLSNPTVSVTRLSGGVQAAGLLLALLYVGVTDLWRTEAQRLRQQVQAMVQRQAAALAPDLEVAPPPPEPPPKRSRWRFWRRSRRGTSRSEE